MIIENRTLKGYAILWDVESRPIHEDGRVFIESIQKGAITLDPNPLTDIKLNFNHLDQNLPVARTGNNSLRLFYDEFGISYEADVPETSLGNDIILLVQNKTLNGESSIGMQVKKQKWLNTNRRIIEHGILKEISIVTDASYPQTRLDRKELEQFQIDRKLLNTYKGKM